MVLNECAALMKEQFEENKKDRYIEITNRLLEENISDKGINDKIEYASVLKDVLSLMDFQIYELYRALADRFAEAVKDIEPIWKPDIYNIFWGRNKRK